MLFFILSIVALPFQILLNLLTQEYFSSYFFCRDKKSNKKNASQQKNSLRLRGVAAYGFAQQFLLQYRAPSAQFIFVSFTTKLFLREG
jgi:hypothetical protein